ncbi:ABC transporter ATP-binding protein [Microbaculum marinum]|uniref:ABC transporter ATP-binding protein n=1 Tax=Microbaculum marinum TaxID=1764581 RepID=A0AAW9RX06_9HYPH
MTDDSVLELRGVEKLYGETRVLGPIDFTVQKGELLTLLGPSGCGKTTTLHIIAGLVEPTVGTVTMSGRDVTNLEPPHRDMGLVFQNYALFPHKTVFDNVAFGLRMRRVGREEIRERVMRVLDVVGLPGVEQRQPHQLSGGQRQRVAVARAVVIEPQVLLLDEPLSNLDALLRKRMRLELRDIQQRLGITTVFVTHDQDEAFEMSDRVILMNRGRIEQLGSPEDLYDRPESRFAAEFIGETNLIDGKVTKANGTTVSIAVTGGAEFQAPLTNGAGAVGQEVYLMVRPERVEIARERPADAAAIGARVTKRVFSGDMLALTLTSADGLEIVSRKPSVSRYRDLEEGSDVWMMLEECRMLPRDDTAVAR